jgi:2'-5' RNA ligase
VEKVRSFIAIELPGEAKRQLGLVQSALKAGGFPVKWVEPGGIHLTLQFLGNIEAGMVERVRQAMQGAVKGIAPFRLQIGETGVFPSPGRPRVVWVGLKGDVKELAKLQQSIESSLVPLGFPPEKRGYTPHLTLGRVRERASPLEQEGLGKLVLETFCRETSAFTVYTVNLMRSQLTPAVALYSLIGYIPLERSCQ